MNAGPAPLGTSDRIEGVAYRLLHLRFPGADAPGSSTQAAGMAPVLGACIAAARRPTPDEVEIVLRRMWRDISGRQALQRPPSGSPEHHRLLTLARAALGALPADPSQEPRT